MKLRGVEARRNKRLLGWGKADNRKSARVGEIEGGSQKDSRSVAAYVY